MSISFNDYSLCTACSISTAINFCKKVPQTCSRVLERHEKCVLCRKLVKDVLGVEIHPSFKTHRKVQNRILVSQSQMVSVTLTNVTKQLSTSRNVHFVNLLHRLYSRFDMFGIYVVMFLEILKTLVQVLVVFSISFGLSFYILLSRDFSHLTTKRANVAGRSNEEVSILP